MSSLSGFWEMQLRSLPPNKKGRIYFQYLNGSSNIKYFILPGKKTQTLQLIAATTMSVFELEEV